MDKPKIEHSKYWYDYNRNDPDRENSFTDAFDHMMGEMVVGGVNIAFEDDGLDYEVDSMATIDDQYSHYFTEYQIADRMDYKPQHAHYYKYHEEEILKDIEEYVSGTYKGHYTGNSHEFRKVQTIDLMASKDLASGFCQANILKYGSRYGNKDGRNKKDLLKVIHYAMLLLHFDEHYSKPPMTSGNIDINMP